MLDRVDAWGGTLVEPATVWPALGWSALVTDSEGDHLDLQSARP